MSRGRVLLGKEMIESWRTLRLPVVAGLLLLVGLTSPLLARFLPEIIEAAAGDQLPTIPIPTPVAADAADQLWKNIAQVGAIAAIVITMGAVSTERERGTAAFVLSKAAGRGAFLGAKVVAVGLVLAIGTLLAGVAGWVYTAILFEPLPVAGWAGLAFLAWLGLCVWAAVTFAGSTITGSTAAAAGIGFVALLVLSIGAAIPTIGSWLPGSLAAPAVAMAAGGPVDTADVVAPVLGSVAIIGIALIAAAWSFRGQEL